MAFGLNFIAINGVFSTQSHRHTKRKTLLKMKRIKDGIKHTRHAKR